MNPIGAFKQTGEKEKEEKHTFGREREREKKKGEFFVFVEDIT